MEKVNFRVPVFLPETAPSKGKAANGAEQGLPVDLGDSVLVRQGRPDSTTEFLRFPKAGIFRASTPIVGGPIIGGPVLGGLAKDAGVSAAALTPEGKSQKLPEPGVTTLQAETLEPQWYIAGSNSFDETTNMTTVERW